MGVERNALRVKGESRIMVSFKFNSVAGKIKRSTRPSLRSALFCIYLCHYRGKIKLAPMQCNGECVSIFQYALFVTIYTDYYF